MRRMLGACPACGSAAGEPTEEVRGYHLVRCSGCGLEYTADPDDQVGSCDATYVGTGGVMEDPLPYGSPARRLSLETMALTLPPPYLTPAERWVLRRLRQRVRPGAVVLDIGCGTGRFLRALRRVGFDPRGVDPASSVVAALGAMGFTVVEGAVPGLPDALAEPEAITAFEVLEHLPEPLDALREARERFPSAPFAGSVPSPSRAGLERGRGASDYPPNHFLRWTTEALEAAFRRAGYSSVVVHLPRPSGAEFLPGFGRIAWAALRRTKVVNGGASPAAPADHVEDPVIPGRRRLLATAACWGQWTYRGLASVVGWPQALRARTRGRSAASLAFWAEP